MSLIFKIWIPVIAVCVSFGVSAQAADYSQAYHQAAQSGRPLVVLVGAEWCPGCVKMKQHVIPQAKQRGSLNQVEFAQMDSDDALAGQIMRGNSIPQLVMFTKSESGWNRTQLTGAKSIGEVESFIHSNMPAPATAVSAVPHDGPRLVGGTTSTASR